MRGGGLTPLCINKICCLLFFLIGELFLERCGGEGEMGQMIDENEN